MGSLLAGRCRLMECYSIPEATQMIHLHAPDFSIFDVRSCSPQQLARTFAAISNIRSGQAVLICVPDQLSEDRIPQEALHFCRIIELSNHDENYSELVEEILSPPGKKAGSIVQRNEQDSSGAFDAAANVSPAAEDAMNRICQPQDVRSVGPVIPPGPRTESRAG